MSEHTGLLAQFRVHGLNVCHVPDFEPPTESGAVVPLDWRSSVAIPDQRGRISPGGRDPRPQAGSVDHVKLLLSGLLEALDGRRPLNQLRHVVSPKVYEALRTRVNRRPITHGPIRLRTARAGRPSPRVIEASGTVAWGGRILAVVARLEKRRTTWRCTEFRLLS